MEYAPEEMKKNGAEVIHFATGMVVGYPPCPHLENFQNFIETKYGLKVVLGTHPIPTSYFGTHNKLGTWKFENWQKIIQPIITDESTRNAFS